MKIEKLSLDEVRAQVEGCRKCQLCEGRTNIVFGEGDPHARVLIIGEAPGKKEDELGRPFVGASGKFLDELLEHAGLKREEVFIANVIKCRPPSNRNPQAAEIEACSPYLRLQTRSIDPDVIVTMGNFATQFILRTGVGITRLRGTWQTAGKFDVMPIFHPAAAIYDRSKRDVLFSDFERVGQYVRDKIAANEQSKQAGESAPNGKSGQLSHE